MGRICAAQQKFGRDDRIGSPPEVTLFGLMSASASSGHYDANAYAAWCHKQL
jgi:hypothetical protein